MKSSFLTHVLSRTSLAACLCLGAMGLGARAWAVEIIGHRGASYDAPENTLASFKLGYKQNADGDELDIYLSKDGKIVVIHDKDTLRTGGVKKAVAEQTLEELRALDVGCWGQWKGKFSEKIPLLSEVLAIIPEGKKLFIEIKCGPEILPGLQKVLAESGRKADQIVIIGFGYDTIKLAKQLMPQYRVLWLNSWAKNKKTGQYPQLEDLIAKSKGASLDGLDLDSRFPIDPAFAQKVKTAGLHLFTWTVDDPEAAKKEVEAGVEGITTDRPGWLREQLAR